MDLHFTPGVCISGEMVDDGFPRLSFELKHDSIVPLSAFTRALERMDSRYAREVRGAKSGEEPRLFIAEIRQGSIIVDLVATGVAAISPLSHTIDAGNHLWEFGKNLATAINYFRGQAPRPAGLSVSDCDDVRAIVGPAAQVEGGGLAISGNNVNIGTLIMLDRFEALGVENKAALERAKLTDAEERVVREVGFVWHQLRDAPAVQGESRSPDRAIIASLGDRPLQVTFASDAVKTAMMHGDFNPFEKAFVVDAKVIVGPNGPLSYRILVVHDTLDQE